MMGISGLNETRESPRCRGFTLLEMMVAVSVIAIVLLAVYRLHSQTLLMNLSTRFYTVAPLLAQNKLADIELNSVKELAEGSGDFGEGYTGYSWEVKIVDVESEQLKSTADKLKRIDVKVLFNQGELTYDLRTYRFFP
jgi:general secretion pathway protein I